MLLLSVGGNTRNIIPLQYELMFTPFLASTSSNSSDIYFIMLIAVIDNFSDVFTKVSTKIAAMDAQHQIDLLHRREILKNNMKIIVRNSWHTSYIFILRGATTTARVEMVRIDISMFS